MSTDILIILGVPMRKNEVTPTSRPLLRAALWNCTPMRIAAFVSAAVILAGCSKAPDADPRTDPPTVLTAHATPASASVRRFSGVVAARIQSNLGFRVNGKVIERQVDIGQTVKRGQPLMKLDPIDL